MTDYRFIPFWGLFPFVIPQAMKLRRNAPRLSGADGPATGKVGAGKTLRMLAIGDSIIAGVGARTIGDALPGQVAHALADVLQREVMWTASGIVGARSSTVLKRLIPNLASEPFDLVVISVGVNDVTSLRTLGQWSKDLNDLVDELHYHSSKALIAFSGLPPMARFPLLPQPLRTVMGIRSRMFDDAAKSVISNKERVFHVPIGFDPDPGQFSPDGYHPSPASYRELGRQIALAAKPYFSD